MTTERSGMSLESIRDDLRGLAEWPTSVSLGRNQFVQWADAIDVHLSRDAVVPAGYVLVPIEINDAMWDACLKACGNAYCDPESIYPPSVWEAMLARRDGG